MASFSFRNGRWQVRIRRKQSKTITASFASKAEATKWARQVERDLTRRPLQVQPPGTIPFSSVGALLEAYEARVTVNKKGAYAESKRVAFLRSCPIGEVPLEDLRRSHVAAYRDTRRALVKDDTIRRELDILSAAINWVRLDFDLDWLVNPVRPVVSTLAKPSLNQRPFAVIRQHRIFGIERCPPCVTTIDEVVRSRGSLCIGTSGSAPPAASVHQSLRLKATTLLAQAPAIRLGSYSPESFSVRRHEAISSDAGLKYAPPERTSARASARAHMRPVCRSRTVSRSSMTTDDVNRDPCR